MNEIPRTKCIVTSHTVSRRPFTNRRKRPQTPGLFRLGDRKRPDVQAERTRLTLFVTNRHLDLAERLLADSEFQTLQKYCEALLEEAIEAERSRSCLDEAEASRGPLEGLREIADDPEYLAEWNASMVAARGGDSNSDEVVIEVVSPLPMPSSLPQASHLSNASTSAASDTVLRHVLNQSSGSGAFLECLRRGESPSADAVSDLVEALGSLDTELAGAGAMDRGLAYALHRLAFESQVLLTDAWPGAFDAETIHTVRAIQEAVDRILSGEDIRYLEG